MRQPKQMSEFVSGQRLKIVDARDFARIENDVSFRNLMVAVPPDIRVPGGPLGIAPTDRRDAVLHDY